MRRSSVRERAGGRWRPTADGPDVRSRAQTEPFVALAAVVVVALALSVWAGAFERSLPESADRDVAEPTADRVERALTVSGVVRTERLYRGTDTDGTDVRSRVLNRTVPEGYRLNVTLVSGDTGKSVGPPAPATAGVATRRVGVGDAGSVSPARLEVRVWT